MDSGSVGASGRSGMDLVFAMKGFSPICVWRLLDDRILLTRRGRGCEEIPLRDITDFYAHRKPNGPTGGDALGCIQFFVGGTLYTLSYAGDESVRGDIAANYIRTHCSTLAPAGGVSE